MVADLWAIAWPILKEVLKKVSQEDFIIAIILYVAILIFSRKLLKRIFPFRAKGNPFTEAWSLIVDVITVVGPLVGPYYFLVSKFPILEGIVEFVLDTDGIVETLIVWGKILLVTSVFFGISRWLIHKVSVLIQRQLQGHFFPLSLVRVAEGMGFVLTAMLVPFFAASLLRSGQEVSGVSQGDPSSKPPSVIKEVWDYIEEGVGRAQSNGVACSPYLIYSLKLYETSINICTELDEDTPRPNKCASYAGAVGMMQFLPETFERNAKRHSVKGSPWNPTDAVEVACYFIAEEVKISLEQTEEEFVEEFSSKGLVWNMDPDGAAVVYKRALKFRKWALEDASDPKQPVPEPKPTPKPDPKPDPKTPPQKVDGYLWPAPKKSYVSFAWGAQMSYGVHNGLDIVLAGFPPFKVVALADGKARYWDGGSCNAGVINFQVKGGETFQYVHMSLQKDEIFIPTNGTWVSVKQGDELGWIHNGTTSCSDGPHLHLMRISGAWIGVKEFIR